MKKKSKTLYHTSPSEIENIHENGLYGSGLFFSDQPYSMSLDDPITYKLESNDDEFLDVNHIPYMEKEDLEKIEPVIKEIKELTGLDEDESIDLLSETTDIHSYFNSLEDYVNWYSEQETNEEEDRSKKDKYERLKKKDLGNISWKIQKLAGKAAKLLGFKGAKLFDEQGASYLIDMLGRENDLRKV